MAIYKLTYIDKGIIRPINISGMNSLESIDAFTMSFDSEIDLIKYLKNKNLIKENTNKVYISKYVESKHNNIRLLNIIYDGDIILFSKDSHKDYSMYIHKKFEEYKAYPQKLLKLSKLYLKKYNNNEKYKNYCFDMYRYATLKIDTNFYGLGFESKRELDDDIERFKNKEFYRLVKGKKVIDYYNFRDLIIKDKYINGEYSIDRNHRDYIKYNKNKVNSIDVPRKFTYFEREEFLTQEDFDRVNEAILDGYNVNGYGYKDGNDYIKQVKRCELLNDLNDIAQKLVLKPGE